MKLNRIALALLVAAPLPMIANAGVTVTPLLLGYHYQGEAQDDQRAVLFTGQEVGNLPGSPLNGGVALQDDVYVGTALGLELTPWMGVEVEYGQTNGDAAANESSTSLGQPYDYKQEFFTGNMYVTSDVITQNYEGAFKPYVLLGAGQSKIKVTNPNVGRLAGAISPSSKDTIGNVGLGAFYRMNDALSLRTELRAVHNFDNNWWEGMAMAGLQVVLGGHLMPVVPVPPPVVEPTPEPTPEPVVVPPPAPVDTDGDGVTDDLDQCPNTPAGVVVDAKGCPQQLTEDLKMELRVFFDINKSNIKDQYKPEIAKVADKLKEYPEASAKIEGHTDNTGPRKLNERLSLARANAVKSMLVSDYSISADRLSTEGFAWDRPIAPNTTVEGRSMNRRVYAIITGSRTVTKMAGQ